MSEPQWEEAKAPAGAFMSWGAQPGQVLLGTVMSFSRTDGTDYAGQPCPELIIELTAPTYSVNKDGERYDFDAGEVITLNLGLKNLRAQVLDAMNHVGPGAAIKIEFVSTQKTSNGTLKVFSVHYAARPQKGPQNGQGAPQYAGTVPRDDAPPF